MSRDDSLGDLVNSRSPTSSASPGSTEFSLSNFLQGLTRSLVLGRSTGGWKDIFFVNASLGMGCCVIVC